jgi:hypothetical protein
VETQKDIDAKEKFILSNLEKIIDMNAIQTGELDREHKKVSL